MALRSYGVLKGKAIEVYRRVLAIEPNNADAKNGLKALGN